MILVWSRKAITGTSRTQRTCREMEEPVNNWLQLKFGNLHCLQLSHDLQQFLFFVNYGYAHISLQLLSIGYIVCFPLATCPSPVLSAYAFATITEFNHAHSSGDIPISSTRCTCFQHPLYSQHLWAWWHFGNHLVNIILERMQLSQHPLISVDMMTFRWSHRSYQSIYQQHLLYSHLQVTLIYYTICRIQK